MHDVTRVETHFDRDALRRICTMPEVEFGASFDLARFDLDPKLFRRGEDFYFHADRGSNILAVAHLDTVMPSHKREANFVDTAAGEVVFSGALDDRLGAFTILDLMPRLGIHFDVLLTVGEESGNSTAGAFEPTKNYDWMIEFDRGGTDVVMYQYDDSDTRERVRRSGARIGDGSFSDISYLEHLAIKGFNWGVGYRDYHGPKAHAYLDDYYMMMAHFLRFHDMFAETSMPHEAIDDEKWWSYKVADDDDAEDYDEDGYYIGPDPDRQVAEENGIYFDREYVENPTPEQIRHAAEMELWHR